MADILDTFEFEDHWGDRSIEDYRFYCCPACDYREVNKTDFMSHVLNNHPYSRDFLIKCEYCHQYFTHHELEDHQFANHTEEIKCEYCKRYFSKAELQEHQCCEKEKTSQEPAPEHPSTTKSDESQARSAERQQCKMCESEKRDKTETDNEILSVLEFRIEVNGQFRQLQDQIQSLSQSINHSGCQPQYQHQQQQHKQQPNQPLLQPRCQLHLPQ